MFKVARPGNRWRYGFATLPEAVAYAALIFRRTGHIVAIESYAPRGRKEAN